MKVQVDVVNLPTFISNYTALPDVFDNESAWRAAFIEFKNALREFWSKQGKVVEW